MAVATGVRWQTDLSTAKEEGAKAALPLLLFLHSHHCGGCRKTLAEVLPDPKVADAINRETIPAIFEASEQPSVATQYNLEWTPTFIIADDSGAELYRWVGYLPVDEFLAQFELGLGWAAFAQGNYEESEKRFHKVVAYPKSVVAPEARYWLGVSEFKRTNDGSASIKTQQDLAKQFPESIWSQKASVWAGNAK